MSPTLRPKVYRRHNCARRHRSWRTFAACVWPRACWVTGDGRYASVSRCGHGPRSARLTVVLTDDLAEAYRLKAGIDRGACGGQCEGEGSHEVIELRPDQEVPR